ncbi:MAG: N-acetylmuramoyl-L-alanine amidase [Peptococcaceae bacterium]|jgi:N-acetylmuramoyl-L-alanine amidase|nr:N-acetylmuramoyl-L-alanine amidase [Peptococcaceae bacterium]
MKRIHGKRLFRKRRVALAIFAVILLAASGFWRLNQRDVQSWSWVVGNRVVVIDAGHGGVDPGAVSKNQTLEKDINLAVAKYLQLYVLQGGGQPVMVRESDLDLGTSEGLRQRKREDLAKRIELADQAQADVFLSIHANSFPNEKLTGPQTFYHAGSAESQELARMIQKELNAVAQSDRAAKDNQDYFILKRANQPTVTIELGFLSNPVEEQWLLTPSYQQKLAWAIYRGLCRYYYGS